MFTCQSLFKYLAMTVKSIGSFTRPRQLVFLTENVRLIEARSPTCRIRNHQKQTYRLPTNFPTYRKSNLIRVRLIETHLYITVLNDCLSRCQSFMKQEDVLWTQLHVPNIQFTTASIRVWRLVDVPVNIHTGELWNNWPRYPFRMINGFSAPSYVSSRQANLNRKNLLCNKRF